MVPVDPATGKAGEPMDVTPLVPAMVHPGPTPNSKAVNLPALTVDAKGDPWLMFRYCRGVNWQIAVTKLDVERGDWAAPRSLADSTYCQDRRASLATGPDGRVYAVWPSDGRSRKQQGVSAVHLARLDGDAPRELSGLVGKTAPAFVEAPKPVNDTPERPRDDHHAWKFGGQKYSLYWGDLHRHTDFSNCRTGDDGCIVEHFRYAYDAAGLDYLATTDHTDAGKTYHPYEWWQNQKLADIFHNPGFFLAFYAYEREQRFPYGHRNVVFTKRGGPIVYISRDTYAASPWAKDLPANKGATGQITPAELWQLLRRSGMQVTTLEHTPAGGMGTDWSVYDQIDSQIETLVEIYQGSRNSYEGVDAPQPAVATSRGTMSFGKSKVGVYQNALRLGYKLGVFASSDHRSTNISFGGVYVKSFDRGGIFEAINTRRSIAATDKIFMEFSCNGHMLGEVFQTRAKPKMIVSVRGTAPIRAVTIVRNEADYKKFPGGKGAAFEVTFTDASPIAGENRYYVRVEQIDGNMGWTSPVWVTYKP